jgi:hypothetical protein
MSIKRVTFSHKVFADNKRDFEIQQITKDFKDTPLTPADIQISYYRGHYGMLGIDNIEEIEDESISQV